MPQKTEDASCKSADEQAKQELWRSAVSLLASQGIDQQQSRSLMGKLVKETAAARHLSTEELRREIVELTAALRALGGA